MDFLLRKTKEIFKFPSRKENPSHFRPFDFIEYFNPPLKTKGRFISYKRNLKNTNFGKVILSNKKVIGVYIDEEVLEDITRLSKHSALSRNALISEMLEFACDCYTQDFHMRLSLKSEFDKSHRVLEPSADGGLSESEIKKCFETEEDGFVWENYEMDTGTKMKARIRAAIEE